MPTRYIKGTFTINDTRVRHNTLLKLSQTGYHYNTSPPRRISLHHRYTGIQSEAT